jgi:Putative peptidoglycan binding domain
MSIQLTTTTPLSRLATADVHWLQTRLSQLGLLDPIVGGSESEPFKPTAPSDGQAGPETRNALRAFTELLPGNLSIPDAAITPEQVQALNAAQPDSFLPLNLHFNLGDDPLIKLAKKILTYMQAQGYWIARHPTACNIVYVEGMNGDGTLNRDELDGWNDRRMVIRIVQGEPQIWVNDQATTEPGRYYTNHPEHFNQTGAARLAFGQYKAWQLGLHHGHQEALVQTGALRIHRDVNKDGFRYTRDQKDPIQIGTGNGINQHSTQANSAPEWINRYSAGCLVGRRLAWHHSFLELLRSDYRAVAHPKYTFMTALVAGSAVVG